MKYVVTRNANALNNDFDALFHNMWGDWGIPSAKMPPVDVEENPNSYLIKADLPGMDEQDVNVSVEKHVLTISSAKECCKDTNADDQKNGKYLVKERVCQTFERSFNLPDGIDEDKITGEFKNGVLTLTLPKTPEETPKKIDVKLS